MRTVATKIKHKKLESRPAKKPITVNSITISSIKPIHAKVGRYNE